MPVLFLLPLLWSFAIALVLLVTPVVAGLDAPETPRLSVSGMLPVARPTATQPVASGPAGPAAYAAYAQGPGARTPGADAFLDGVETHTLRLVNEERRRAGRPSLAPDDRLAAVARAHSRDMLVRGYFQHVTPEGLTPADRVAGVHRRHVGVSGENLWARNGDHTADTAAIAAQAVRDLMASAGHKENILRDSFTHLGVGVAADSGQIRLTQVFGGLRALLDADLPQRVRQNAPLTLRATPFGAGAKPPTQFGLFAPAKGNALLGPEPLATAAARVPPGDYRLQLYFPEGQGWTIVFGPDLKVEP